MNMDHHATQMVSVGGYLRSLTTGVLREDKEEHSI